MVWPLFHYLLDRVPLDANDWAAYEDANRRFADAVASVYRPGDMVWVHDYQLMLVPGMLRERVPRARRSDLTAATACRASRRVLPS